MSEELLEVKPEFMGIQSGKYPGAFPPKVEERIRKIVASPCLHLFSGSSRIGDERIDLTNHNATIRMDVFDFVKHDNRDWNFVLLDPPYSMSERNTEALGYAKHDTFPWSYKKRRDEFELFIQNHAENVLWFDIVSPRPPGFDKYKTWLYIKGGYSTVRVLTWLKRKGERLI